jgi:TetR/AcrR family transcriptional repressor of nem operon
MVEPAHASKAKFLDAALHVLRAKGYTATRVDDICEHAGLSKGSFFHHFKSKEDLALAAADHFAALADQSFASAPYQQRADPLERLLGYVEYRSSILHGELPDYTCLLGTMVQEVYDTHPEIRAACERHLGAHVDSLARDITEAKARYAPSAPWTPQTLAVFAQAVVQGAFVLAKAKQSHDSAVECLRHLERYLQTQFEHSLPGD